MTSPFNVPEFLERVGRRLVLEFDDAAQAGHPGLIGGSRELPARRQLERLLPPVAAVGSGVVFDSFGNVSRQQDIVVYERMYCPVFSVNDTPEATYYPVEGVIGVVEVKSALGAAELADAADKIASVKRLRRLSVLTTEPWGPPYRSYRSYGSSTVFAAEPEKSYDQVGKVFDQVFGAVLCGRFTVRGETMLNTFRENVRSRQRQEAINLVVSLNDGFLQGLDERRQVFVTSPQGTNRLALCKAPSAAFPTLLRMLSLVTRKGRTVDTSSFHRYFFSIGDEPTADFVSVTVDEEERP